MTSSMIGAALTRLWRGLTAALSTTCPTCGHRLSQHPDGGAGGVCLHCDGEMK